MELKFKIIEILPLQEGTSQAGKAWMKQQFIGETSGQYPKKICLSTFSKNVIDTIDVGQQVIATVEVSSREYKEKWYTEVNVLKIESGTVSKPTPEPETETETEGDLPF
jgi:hypothetical protein